MSNYFPEILTNGSNIIKDHNFCQNEFRMSLAQDSFMSREGSDLQVLCTKYRLISDGIFWWPSDMKAGT